ncbi:uncharacterized protein DEA37_0012327, partial [Paragonimus westermani]
DPLILELHSYVLCDTGTVTRQTPSCTRGTQFWFCLLPTTNHIIQNTLNLLEECVKRVQLRYSSKSVSHWLANPIAFRSFASFRPENVNSVNDPTRSTFVWIDSIPLLAPVDWQLPSSTRICSNADSCSSSTERSNTVASMLQLFLMHIRRELESELLSADASVEKPTEPLGGALNNQGECVFCPFVGVYRFVCTIRLLHLFMTSYQRVNDCPLFRFWLNSLWIILFLTCNIIFHLYCLNIDCLPSCLNAHPTTFLCRALSVNDLLSRFRHTDLHVDILFLSIYSYK